MDLHTLTLARPPLWALRGVLGALACPGPREGAFDAAREAELSALADVVFKATGPLELEVALRNAITPRDAEPSGSPRHECRGTGRVAKARSGLPIGFSSGPTTGSPAESGFRALFMCPGIYAGGS